MKSSPAIIESLNGLLRDELAAVNQYTAHYQMVDNWGFDRLKAMILDRANDERQHAEKLIARILFLEGVPVVSIIGEVTTGNAVPAQLAADLASEVRAVANYRAAIASAESSGDYATGELLRAIEAEEEDHVNEIEGQNDQIAMMGLPQYLAQQVKA